MYLLLLRSLKYIGASIATVLALMQIWSMLTAPSSSLNADISFGSFVIPPGLAERLDQISRLTDEPTLKSQVDVSGALDVIQDKNQRELATDRVLSRIRSFLQADLPRGIPPPYSGIRGYWEVRVRNSGTKAVSDTVLTLPDIVYVLVEREGQLTKHGETSSVLRLEKLQPREEIKVMAWTAYTKPSLYGSDQIKLTHGEGVGTVTVRAPVGPLWQWMDKLLEPRRVRCDRVISCSYRNGDCPAH